MSGERIKLKQLNATAPELHTRWAARTWLRFVIQKTNKIRFYCNCVEKVGICIWDAINTFELNIQLRNLILGWGFAKVFTSGWFLCSLMNEFSLNDKVTNSGVAFQFATREESQPWRLLQLYNFFVRGKWGYELVLHPQFLNIFHFSTLNSF